MYRCVSKDCLIDVPVWDKAQPTHHRVEDTKSALPMSSRRPANTTASINAAALRSELEQLKVAHLAAEKAGRLAETDIAAAPPSPKSVEGTPTPSFDQLSPVEQAAGSMGVHPEAWKPIKFMNNAHYDALMKSNAIDETLARRIEAFKYVASQ